ncbi:hypothetical protein GOODEAATRI_014038, partial [Goodea atripinnis]
FVTLWLKRFCSEAPFLLLICLCVKRNEAELSEENHRRKQEKQSMEAELQLMKKERDTFELLVLEDQHREEVAALKKKLQWFAENQELLDRDAGR